MTVEEAIRIRRSTRTFTETAPDTVEIERLCGDGLAVIARNFDTKDGRVGTYGVIKGSPAYIAVSGEDLLQCGRNGERAVIELTRLGYGTCWLGGTFSRSDATRATGIDGRIHCVIAVGTPADRPGVVDRVMRFAAGSDRRKPVSHIVISGNVPEDMWAAVESVRLAPSASNCQPWRLSFDPSGVIDVYGKPSDSFLMIDMGIAIEHFLLMRPDYEMQPPRPGMAQPGLVHVATLVRRH